MRVIWFVERCSTFEITLTPALSRSTGRGGKSYDFAASSAMMIVTSSPSGPTMPLMP